MTARWGDPVRRAVAPVMVAAPAVSTDDVTRLLERREARPVEDVAVPSSESPVATLLARRDARAVMAETQNEGVEDEAPVEALLARRAEPRRQPADDLTVDVVSVAGLIAAREARGAAAAAVPPPDSSVEALLARRAARAAEPVTPTTELDAGPEAASPSLDALLARRDARHRTDSSPEETP